MFVGAWGEGEGLVEATGGVEGGDGWAVGGEGFEDGLASGGVFGSGAADVGGEEAAGA